MLTNIPPRHAAGNAYAPDCDAGENAAAIGVEYAGKTSAGATVFAQLAPLRYAT